MYSKKFTILALVGLINYTSAETVHNSAMETVELRPMILAETDSYAEVDLEADADSEIFGRGRRSRSARGAAAGG